MPRTRKPADVLTKTGEWMQAVPRLGDPRYSQSLERGLEILCCFSPERAVLGIADIADELGMSRSTTHRYVITLAALGYLEQDASRKYRLGLRVTDLGMSALNGTGLRDHSRLYVEELRQRTSYTVNLALLDGTEVLYVGRARGFRRGQGEIEFGLAVGSRRPVHCTAMGKVLLAYLPEHEQRTRLAELKLAKQAPNTITRKQALLEELEQTRQEGLAVADQEFAKGLQEIAAPVRSSDREVIAAINIETHMSMIELDELVDGLGSHLKATADQISARLGYRRDDERKAGR